ncbi:MAG: hypothetical protein AAF845_17320 [Bacteroidota bacterium]
MRALILALLVAFALPAATQEYVLAYERDVNISEGPETVLVYFGASNCRPCYDDAFKATLEAAKVALFERTEAEGASFAVVGVAVDHSIEEGLAFLSQSGRFDEVVIGRNWFNSAVLAHVWRPEGIEDRVPGLPGIMVFERDMTMGETGIAAGEPTYLVELVGAEDIPAWVEAGAPLDGE